MKCAYCNNEIPQGEEIDFNGLHFCNTIHRYSWKNVSPNTHVNSVQSAVSAQLLTSTTTAKPSILQKSLFGILYFVLFYLLISFTLGGIIGGLAGVEAGHAGKDVSEAARIAGQELGAKYGIIFILAAITLSTIGSIKGWFPGTRKKKTA